MDLQWGYIYSKRGSESLELSLDLRTRFFPLSTSSKSLGTGVPSFPVGSLLTQSINNAVTQMTVIMSTADGIITSDTTIVMSKLAVKSNTVNTITGRWKVSTSRRLRDGMRRSMTRTSIDHSHWLVLVDVFNILVSGARRIKCGEDVGTIVSVLVVEPGDKPMIEWVLMSVQRNSSAIEADGYVSKHECVVVKVINVFVSMMLVVR